MTYRIPSPNIAALMDAPSLPEFRGSPDGKQMLILEPAGFLSISDLAKPERHLAGLRFNPETFASVRVAAYCGLSFLDPVTGRQQRVEGIPDSARLFSVTWAPDGSAIAFTRILSGKLTLWMAAMEDPCGVQVLEAPLNAVVGSPYVWLPDSTGWLCKLAPPSDAAPPSSRLPEGPSVEEHEGGQPAPARTNPDLLKSVADEDLFEYFITSDLAVVSRSGEQTRLGMTGGIAGMQPSPDGRYYLVQSIRRPYSRQVPFMRFPWRIEVLDAAGACVKGIADLPLAESMPIGHDAVRTGPRSVGWRADRPATLAWIEAADGGDPKNPAAIRDRILTLDAPFDQAPLELMASAWRIQRIYWGTDRLALVQDAWRKTRTVNLWRVDPARPGATAQRLFSYGQQDRYADPGLPWQQGNGHGGRVLMTVGADRAVVLFGQGGSDDGDRPFVDTLNSDTGKTQRRWQASKPGFYDAPVLLNADGLLLFSRESVAEPPNLFVQPLAGGEPHRLTAFRHPFPLLKDVRKTMIRYSRADGVGLTAKLYLPPGKTEADGPFPTLLWAYPSEYKDAASAGQVKASPYRFPEIEWRSPLVWLVKGYAVLDRPDIPIIGAGDREPNDTYVEQLVASAEAAVAELERRGVSDRRRIAVGGHSYGGFMTANLLAHTRLFRAGIARSGAYNRTLTPFSFQAEERTLWEAPDVYLRMSPFMHADRIRDPLLLIHGMADENEGTFPLQSERLYQALKGLGLPARLVLLPCEGHAYRARESVMHMLWETEHWLERFMK